MLLPSPQPCTCRLGSVLLARTAAPAPLAAAEQPLKAAAGGRSSSQATRPPPPPTKQGERGRPCPALAHPPSGQLSPELRCEMRGGGWGAVKGT